MATSVVMTALSPTMTEGKVAKWSKKEGDPVKLGEVIAEVETDKAIMDLEAPEDGILLKIFVQPGEPVPVGGTLGAIGQAGEDVSALAPKASGAPKAARPEKALTPGGNGTPQEVPPAAPGRVNGPSFVVPSATTSNCSICADVPIVRVQNPMAVR